MRQLLAGTAFALLVPMAVAAQGTGSEGYFQIYNGTDNNVIVGFYTNAGDGWSYNWLDGIQIMPGESAEAVFNDDTGPCEQVFAVGWLGSDGGEVIDDPISIDICAASNIYATDNEIYYD